MTNKTKGIFPATIKLPAAPKKIHWDPQAVTTSSSSFNNAVAMRNNLINILRQQGITDQQVLAAIRKVNRHKFIDPALFSQAYYDISLPIGLKQTISKPSVVAKMLHLLMAKNNKKLTKVLEIGSGCGYQAAVLAQIYTTVYSIERLEQLYLTAKRNLSTENITNVKLFFADGLLGHTSAAPYDAIIAAASGEAIPKTWLQQLAIGGRLIAPVQIKQQQYLHLIDKVAENKFNRQLLEPVLFVPLQTGVVCI